MIRLVTVIGHGTNLLSHFINHYKKYVDEINIAVYETDTYPLLGNEVKEIIDNHDNVRIHNQMIGGSLQTLMSSIYIPMII